MSLRCLTLVFAAISAAADPAPPDPAPPDPALIQEIHDKQVIRLVLPNGQCDAKIESRDSDQLILTLKKTTSVCGKRNSSIRLLRADIEDVEDNRPRRQRPGPGMSKAGFCTVAIATVVAASAGQYVGETVGDWQGLAVIAGGAVAGAVLCHGVFHHRDARYSVFARRIIPAQP